MKIRDCVRQLFGPLLWELGIEALEGVLYWKWVLVGYMGRKVSLNMEQKAVVVIPSYSARRVRNVERILRATLKCDFVEKVIISNNNPQIRIEDWVKLNDGRVALINQPVRHGSGYVWVVASMENADYFVVIDDDTLVYPRQVAVLFQGLIELPEVPHGLAGCRPDGEYVDRREMEVDYLYNIYAVTKAHIQTYLEYLEEITLKNYASQESIEFWGDDILISQAGIHPPRIHDAGYILRCQTSNTPGIAIWKEDEFQPRRVEVLQVLERVKSDRRVSLNTSCQYSAW